MAGRPRAPREIIPLGQLLTPQQVADEVWNLSSLLPELHPEDKCIQWLAKRRLIKNTFLCVICHLPASLVAYGQGVDGVRWSCWGCNFRQSIRSGSFFEGSHLSLRQIVLLTYCWSCDMPQTMIAHEGATSIRTAIDWCNFCREECEAYIIRHSGEIGGMDAAGNAIVVEIDETKYFHRKYHLGQWPDGHWVFGGVERDSGKCFLAEVPNRTAAALTAEIVAHILPGSHIVSDGWAAYVDIPNIHNSIYTHSVVDANFVDRQDSEVHTQNVENMWMRAKRKLKRQYGTGRALFPFFLHEFMFRNAIRDGDVFTTFLIAVAESYPV